MTNSYAKTGVDPFTVYDNQLTVDGKWEIADFSFPHSHETSLAIPIPMVIQWCRYLPSDVS